MSPKKQHAPKSGCPIAHALDVVGDRWTLLVLREVMVRQRHEFGEFLKMEEGIATNILTDRLKRLVEYGVLQFIVHPENKKKKLYYLTEKGIALIPAIMELTLWSIENVEGLPTDPQFEFFVNNTSVVKAKLQQAARDWRGENVV